MKYEFELWVRGIRRHTYISRFEQALTPDQLKAKGDEMYQKYIESYCPAEYPSAVLHVKYGSKDHRTVRYFHRRADSGASGFPDLWTEQSAA